ncbi:MAG: hypothetical protein AAB466_05195 [Verrucomicrobiota bacterium]
MILLVIYAAVLPVAVVLLLLLGLAFILIPGGLGILTIEYERASRWLRHAWDILLRTKPLTKKETL